MKYMCKSCGGEGPIKTGVSCSSCGTILVGIASEVDIAMPVGIIKSGNPENPLGCKIESRPALGGESNSSIAADGSFQAELSGSLERGRSGEWHVVKTLLAKLKSLGYEVCKGDDARDEYGEDGVLHVDNRRVPIQIVTVPSQSDLWRELHKKNIVKISGDLAEAVSLIREAIVEKSIKAESNLLALDLYHLGVIVTRRVVNSYLDQYDDPVNEFQFESVWLVGPTIRSTIELSAYYR